MKGELAFCDRETTTTHKVAYLTEVVTPDLVEETKEPICAPPASKIKSEERKWSGGAEQTTFMKKSDHETFETKMQKYDWSTSLYKTERNRSGVSNQKTNFKDVANKWKQRTEEHPNPCQPGRRDSLPRSEKKDASVSHSRGVKSLDETFSSSSASKFFEERPTSLNLASRNDVSERKFSVPEFGSSPKMREKREGSDEMSSRPTSLIESNSVLQPEGPYMNPPSLTSTDSRDDMFDSSAELSRAGSKEILDAFSKPCLPLFPSSKISDIMRAFEPSEIKGAGGFHPRMSSLDSDDGSGGAHYGSVSSLASGTRDQYGSITSLSSSTSIISPQVRTILDLPLRYMAAVYLIIQLLCLSNPVAKLLICAKLINFV